VTPTMMTNSKYCGVNRIFNSRGVLYRIKAERVYWWGCSPTMTQA
jgi:hypothetical protein